MYDALEVILFIYNNNGNWYHLILPKHPTPQCPFATHEIHPLSGPSNSPKTEQ